MKSYRSFSQGFGSLIILGHVILSCFAVAMIQSCIAYHYSRVADRMRKKTLKKTLCFAEKSLIVEGKREKKKVDRLTMQVSSLQKEPFTITPGKLVLSGKNYGCWK